MKDEDWNVYKDLNKHGFEEDEEEIIQLLEEMNEKITEMDPNALEPREQKKPSAEDY